MPTAEVDGAQLAYKVDGQGPALVLVHAGIADMRMWDPLAALLDHRYRVVRYDMRGHGETTYTAGESSDADDLGALLTALDIDACTLVGASFGGLVALDLAAARPDRVLGLVLADPPLPGYAWSEEMRGFFAAEEAALEAGDLEAATDVNVEFWLGAAPGPVQEAIREQQLNAFRLQADDEPDDSLLTADLPGALATLEVATLVLTGEHDKADFRAIGDRLAATLPHARRAVVPRAGHLPSLEQPAAFDEIALRFLDGRG